MTALWMITLGINFRLTLENNSWTPIEVFALILMLLLTIAWACFFNFVPSTQYNGSFSWPLLTQTLGGLLSNFIFYANLLLVVFLVVAPRFLHQVWSSL